MAAPAPAVQKALAITPATADVNSNAACQFTVDPPGTKVHWQIKPQIGEIDENGVYQSPKKISMPQTVIVTATAVDSEQSATATIELTDAPLRVRWLGWYAIAIGAVLAIGILAAWNYLYWPPGAPVVVVNPPLVTLDPNRDEKFSFAATVLGDSKGAVTWSVTGGGEIDSNGVFRQNLDASAGIDKIVTVRATSVTDPSRSGSSVVHLLSGRHLEITPQPVWVFASQQVPFRTPSAQVKWSVSRPDIASISPDGMFTAGYPHRPQEIVQVMARGENPHEQAATAVVITPPVGADGFNNWPLLLFVMMCGALGSMVYYATSFVGYVGNRTFRSSWFWFYVSRPFVGGALAVIFFFILGSGMIGGASAGDLMKIGMISALVGLFSDKALKKLSDVMDALLATKDERKDKLGEAQAAAPAAPGAAAPKIVSVDPDSIPANAKGSVTVKGVNFKAGFKVKVNGQDATPTQATEQSFGLEIPAALATPPKVTITVTTGQGRADFDLPVK